MLREYELQDTYAAFQADIQDRLDNEILINFENLDDLITDIQSFAIALPQAIKVLKEDMIELKSSSYSHVYAGLLDDVQINQIDQARNLRINQLLALAKDLQAQALHLKGGA